MIRRLAPADADLRVLGLAALAAAIAALIVVAGLSPSPKIALLSAGAIAGAGMMIASGNPRLFCLWGLGLTAPLGIAKRFHPLPHMGGAGAYSIEAVDFFLVALVCFLVRDILAGHRRLRLSPVTFWWSVMILLGAFTASVGPFGHLPLVEAVQMAKTLLLFLVLVNELVRVRQFLHLFAALCCGLMLQSLIGILQYAKKGAIGLQSLGEATATTLEYANKATYMDGGDTFRIGALLGHPNLLAGFIVIIAPMLLAMLATRVGRVWRWPIALTLATAMLALLLTLSRSGWLAFALAVPIVIALLLRHPASRHRAAPLAIATLTATALGAIAAAPAILHRFTGSDPGALDFRWEWMSVAWGMVKDHWLVGTGLNSFVYNLPGRTEYGGHVGLIQRFGADWPVVHNIYLLTWAEQGTIGFVAFLAVLLTLLRIGWRNARDCADPTLHALSIGALAGLCANLVDGFGSFYLRQMPGARVFWMAAAIVVAVRYWQMANRPVTA
ncbi:MULTISPECIES: O-antigen ligase family protein [Sphingomonas]|uniref:O-antigen ligase family protein n=1 Tax=Sphingomonas TaxID=13687 RepID=UPI00092C94E3|nr:MULTISPECIES: O-antigen ligase family protein [unclassified Sphingomonas]MCW6529178.1 O-antigen ligase family protein [Sphingomonas lycopersici]OJU17939.1 MAG: hypothetical protein BGN95_16960 [Sphingomonas sp. 66-10]